MTMQKELVVIFFHTHPQIELPDYRARRLAGDFAVILLNNLSDVRLPLTLRGNDVNK